MINFETKFFQKQDFTKEDIMQLWDNAKRDLIIAKKDSLPEVKFTYSYNALIKSGIALIAKTGKVKVRSVQGHHIKILEKMSKILKDEEIRVIGNAMRTKRNLDFYGGGVEVSEKEGHDYYVFVERILNKIDKYL